MSDEENEQEAAVADPEVEPAAKPEPNTKLTKRPEDGPPAKSATPRPPQLPAKHDFAVAAAAEGEYHGVKWAAHLKAAGLWGGCVLAGAGTVGIFSWGAPFTNPAHNVLALLSMLVAGIFTGLAVSAGRLQDALDQIAVRRREIDAMAEQKRELEKAILKTRGSSVGGGRKNKKGG